MLKLRTGSAIIVLVTSWLILCSPWFVRKQTIPWDNKDYFYPSMYFVSQSIRSGESPLWNPYVFGGYPIASDPQASMFSPIALAMMTAVNKPSFHWFDTVELLHILIGGVGMLLACIRFGWSPAAGLFAALVYMFGGSASARMQHVSMIFAYSYFPLCLLLLEQTLRSNRIQWGVAFGVAAGIMAAHQNQVAYLFSLVLIGYVFYRALASESFLRFLKARWLVLAAAFSTGILIVSVPVYLTLQFLPLSNRPHIAFDVAVQDSIHPLTYITLIVRDFFDNVRPSTYWGLGDITETYLYAGILPVVLIARYGFPSGEIFKREFRYFSIIGFLAVLYALGRFTYFYWLAYHLVPGVSLYRRPVDATFIINMVLAVATGFLMDRILCGWRPRMKRALLLAEILGLTGFVTWAVMYAWREGKSAYIMKDSGRAILFAAVALLLLHALTVAHKVQSRIALAMVCLVLLAADLKAHNAGSILNAADPSWSTLLSEEPASHDRVARFLSDDLQAHGNELPYRADITWSGSLWANVPMVFRIQSTQGYNPLQYALYKRVAGAQEDFQVVRPFTLMMPGYNSPLLNLLGVKYVVSAKDIREIDARIDEKRFPLVLDQLGIKIRQNPEALPRILTATAIYLEPDLDHMIDEGTIAPVDYRSTAVLQHLPETLRYMRTDTESVAPLSGDGKAAAVLVSYRNTEVVVAVQSERDVILLLNDLYYPYWRVYIDGQEHELLRANYLFRGVHVMPGEHQVIFRFEPFSSLAIRDTFLRLLYRQ